MLHEFHLSKKISSYFEFDFYLWKNKLQRGAVVILHAVRIKLGVLDC